MHFFIVNPASRSCPKDIRSIIHARFPSALVSFTKGSGDAYLLAKDAMESPVPPNVVVACGGDGTFREVSSAVGDGAVLGILPLGTVNQIAGQLGIKDDLNFALDIVENQNITQIYPGVVKLDDHPAPWYFFIGMSAGVDADAVHLVNRPLKKIIGGSAYLLSFFNRLASPVLPGIKITTGSKTVLASQMIALKNSLYGGSMKFSAKLALNSPGLEIAHTSGGRAGILGFFGGSFLGAGRKNLELEPGEEATIEVPLPGYIQIDGDAVSAGQITLRAGQTPVRVLTSLGD